MTERPWRARKLDDGSWIVEGAQNDQDGSGVEKKIITIGKIGVNDYNGWVPVAKIVQHGQDGEDDAGVTAVSPYLLDIIDSLLIVIHKHQKKLTHKEKEIVDLAEAVAAQHARK